MVGLFVVALILAAGFAAGFFCRDYMSRRRRAHYLKYRSGRGSDDVTDQASPLTR